MTFGENLRLLRTRMKLTQKDMSLALCISHQSISKWEKDISVPNIQYCVPLTKVLKCTLDELFQTKTTSKN